MQHSKTLQMSIKTNNLDAWWVCHITKGGVQALLPQATTLPSLQSAANEYWFETIVVMLQVASFESALLVSPPTAPPQPRIPPIECGIVPEEFDVFVDDWTGVLGKGQTFLRLVTVHDQPDQEKFFVGFQHYMRHCYCWHGNASLQQI